MTVRSPFAGMFAVAMDPRQCRGQNADLSRTNARRRVQERDMQLQPIYRITVFVPRDALRGLVEGVKRVYPLGDDYYDSVLWYLEDAREEFRARPGARPARGKAGELHQEAVSMLVFSLPRERELLDRVLEEGVKANHPWEAPGLFVEESWTLEHGKKTPNPE